MKELHVGNVGSDRFGVFVDVRSVGDEIVIDGDRLKSDHEGSRHDVRVTRIEIYGQPFRMLEPGLTARVWLHPPPAVESIRVGMTLRGLV